MCESGTARKNVYGRSSATCSRINRFFRQVTVKRLGEPPRSESPIFMIDSGKSKFHGDGRQLWKSTITSWRFGDLRYGVPLWTSDEIGECTSQNSLDLVNICERA